MMLPSNLTLSRLRVSNLFVLVLAIQLAEWGIIWASSIGLGIPLLQPVIGFIYLTFIPGILIYRLLDLKGLDISEIIICICGLSIIFLMFIGFSINIVYPIFGISKPLAPFSLMITIRLGILILFILSFTKDNSSFPKLAYHKSDFSNYKVPMLFLTLLPSLAIIGTYFVNSFKINLLLMLMIIVISLIIILIGFTNIIDPTSYPFLVFVIAISLLFHYSLISTYLTGADIQLEYYAYKYIISNGYYDYNIHSNINAMLSVTILPVIYSSFLNLEGTWIFKIIYPFFFALLPMGLYNIFLRQVGNDKMSFFSVVYFISLYPYYGEMLSLARQQIAEFFLMLLLLVIVSKIESMSKRILLILFGLALVVSHYGLSYLFLILIIPGYIITRIIKHNKTTIGLPYILMYTIFLFAWYTVLSQGSPFESILTLGAHIATTISDTVLATPATSLIEGESATIYLKLLKILYIISQFFIIIGFFFSLFKKDEFRFSYEYMCLSAVSFLALGAASLTPSTGMNIHRLYHITAIILSPFFVLGVIAVSRTLLNAARLKGIAPRKNISGKLITLFLVIFLLLNCGFLQEIAQSKPVSIPLSLKSILANGDNSAKNMVFATMFAEEDINSIGWISKYRDMKVDIYADFCHKLLSFTGYGMMPMNVMNNSEMRTILRESTENIKYGSYIYLGYFNIHFGLMNGPDLLYHYWNTSDIQTLISPRSEIYSNGGSFIYK